MKRIALICICVFLSSRDYGQNKKIYFESDTSYSYPNSFPDAKRMELQDLKKSPYKSHYRFWRFGQIIEIWSEDNIVYHGSLINYINKLGRHYNRKIISKKQTIDSADAHKIAEAYLALKNIPSQKGIAEWQTGMDGETLIIEYATANTYSSKSYWEPDGQRSNEGIAINKFYTQLKTWLTLSDKYNAFEAMLPFGKYSIGMMIMTKYGSKMKPKGGSSLFR